MGPVTEHVIHWQGMAIKIRHVAAWIGGYDHLGIYSIEPEGVPPPITETGYRSHFLPGWELEEQGGAVAFVTAWLDHAAKSDRWQSNRQMSLF